MRGLFTAFLVMFLFAGMTSAQEREERIIAIGDLHGDFEAYIDVLHSAGLVNESGRRWTGGSTQLVQLGDVLDRGPDGLLILEHLQDLERKARRRGGAVHRLAGNHEAMHLTGDYRYVDPSEYEALVDRRSEERRNAFFDRMVEAASDYASDQEEPFDEAGYRDHLLSEWPLGKYEYVALFAPGGEHRERILELDIVTRLGDIVFVHGGISPEYAALGLNEINTRGREELETGDRSAEALINDETGPLWHRSYAMQDDGAGDDLQAALDMLDARVMVVGHTPLTGRVSSLYDGRLILADVGLSRAYRGARSFLEIAPDGSMRAWVEGEYQSVRPMRE